MKPATLLLIASLAANAALVAVLATRTSGTSSAVPSGKGATPPATSSTSGVDALRAALASGDAKALAEAGVPPEIARELAIGRTFSRMADKMRGAQAKKSDGRWWRARPGLADPNTREQQLVARRELSEALLAAFGDDFGLASSGDQSQFAFLSPEKRDALRRINQDYDEMMAKFSAGGVLLASDRERLRLLRQERERDIAALLTPEERLAYEMRTSVSGNIVKSRFGDAIESEAEFQKIYALQKAFDEKFSREALSGRITPEVMRSRAEAERQLEADIRSAVGDDRYAALRRAADSDVRTVDALVSRLNLPAATTDNLLASRETFAAESQRINSDASIPMPQRRADIQALAARAKSQITQALGSEGADAYAQRSPWLNMLQSGMAFSTTPTENHPGFPGGGQSIYPVPPAGAGPAGGQRQIVFSSAAPIDGVIGVAGDPAIVDQGVRVMSFSTTSSTDAAPAAPGGGPGVRQTIVQPAQSAPVSPTANPTPKR